MRSSDVTKLYNRKTQIDQRRALRKSQTNAECLVWEEIRNNQILKYKFKRQYSIGPFVLDFYCPKIKFAIEIDGPIHGTLTQKTHDLKRQDFLEALGIFVFRFSNKEVVTDLGAVIEKIKSKAAELSAGLE